MAKDNDKVEPKPEAAPKTPKPKAGAKPKCDTPEEWAAEEARVAGTTPKK